MLERCAWLDVTICTMTSCQRKLSKQHQLWKKAPSWILTKKLYCYQFQNFFLQNKTNKKTPTKTSPQQQPPPHRDRSFEALLLRAGQSLLFVSAEEEQGKQPQQNGQEHKQTLRSHACCAVGLHAACPQQPVSAAVAACIALGTVPQWDRQKRWNVNKGPAVLLHQFLHLQLLPWGREEQ